MEPIWLAEYPPGVPATIDPDSTGTLPELFAESCARFADRAACRSLGHEISYAELARRAGEFTAWLQGLGVAPGTRVALMMPNVLQYPVALFGTLAAGCTVVGVNPLYTPRELEHQLADSGAEVIVILENFAHVLQKVVARTAIRHIVVTAMGDLLPVPRRWLVNAVVRHVKKLVRPYELPRAIPFADTQAGGTPQPVTVAATDVAFLQYTGGTTGVAKGAMLTHRNLAANLLQATAWITPALGGVGNGTIVTALPLYHIFSLTANCLTFLRMGWCNLLIPNPRDIPVFVDELAKAPVHGITGVNTLFNALLNHAEFGRIDWSQLKVSLAGGMALQRAVAERWAKATGVTLVEAYGLTETSPAVCVNPLSLAEYNAAIGLPLPSTEISIRDADGVELGIDEAGELCVRGPQVMAGYWQRPDETVKVLDAEGWLRTGDIARVDARGYVHLVDRKKDMILVSGFNVYPNEVEDYVMQHPGVLEAAAVGAEDPVCGEVVRLVVVRRDPQLTAEALIAHCRTGLTGYKIPKFVEFRDELPKTPVGKILRRKLRDGDDAGDEGAA